MTDDESNEEFKRLERRMDRIIAHMENERNARPDATAIAVLTTQMTEVIGKLEKRENSDTQQWKALDEIRVRLGVLDTHERELSTHEKRMDIISARVDTINKRAWVVASSLLLGAIGYLASALQSLFKGGH